MKYPFTFIYMVMFVSFSLTDYAAAITDIPESYRVGIGDVIHINVIGHRDLSTASPIAVDGTIAFPNLGAVYVKDKTLPEIEKEITEKLSEGYIKFPVVSVSLVSSQSKKIYILGETGGGRQVPYEKDLTIIKALALSGGVPESGLYGNIVLRRRMENQGYVNILEADLHKGLINDKKTEDTLLEPDDILIIEHSESFFIRGEVMKNGQLVLEDDMTVSRAITIAGGIAQNGLHGKVRIRRKREDGSGYQDVVESNLDNGNIVKREIEDFMLQSDDILIVERNETFFIEGEVTRAGQYELEYGMTVGRAITVAGGIAEGGIYGKIRVRRKRLGEAGFDDLEIKLKEIIEGKETDEFLLKPDDIVIVERSKTFILYGEVGRIGEFPLAEDTTVFKAIVNNGGFSQWGSESKIKILRPSEDGNRIDQIKVNLKKYLDGDPAVDIPLKPGDIVVVSSGFF